MNNGYNQSRTIRYNTTASREIIRIGGTMSTALTKTERKIMLMRADGMQSNQIADSMCRSKRTIDMHLYNAYKKTGIKNITELIKYVNENDMK